MLQGMTRYEFHPAVQNCTKIPWLQDQTKAGRRPKCIRTNAEYAEILEHTELFRKPSRYAILELYGFRNYERE
jgi:hypothetical protein